MIESVRASKEELSARYGIPERLAVRILALRSRGLGVSGALLEEAVRSPKIAEFLLSADLLERAAKLDKAKLRRLGAEAQALSVVGGVLCLEEEVQAETVGDATPERLPAQVPRRSSARGLDARESRQAFPAEEISRLKLVILTAVDASAKVEALRRIALAPLGHEEKGVLALRAVADPSPEVRREAAEVLASMGLDGELAEALKTAASGSARQKELAIRKIALLGRRIGPAERSVAMAALVSMLEFEKDAAVLKETLAALSAFSETIASRSETLASLARHLVRILAEHFAALASQARVLLDAVGAMKNPETPSILWKEAEGTGDRALRAFFLESFFSMELPKDLERTLCRIAAEDLSVRPLEDLESRRVADALRLRGDAALEALLETVPVLKEEARALLLPVLDSVASGPDINAKLRNRTAEYFLQALREGSRALRTGIIEARLCSHPGLDPALKRKLAADFILNLHSFRAERIHNLTAGAIRRIGRAAEEPLVQAVKKSPHQVERDEAARLLAELAEEEREDRDIVVRIVEFLRSPEAGERIPVGLVVRCAGRAAHGPLAPEALVAELLADFGARVGKVPYSFDLVAALGWLASAPACDAGRASETALKFMDLLDSPMPDVEVNETHGDEGTHLFVGAQTTVYTDLIPELLAGLRRISEAGRVAPGVRRRLAERLRERYAAVTEYREIWAPGNVVQLGEVLVAFASAPGTGSEERKLLVNALRTNLRNLGTVQILAEVFARADEDEPAYVESLEAFISEILAFLDRREYQEREDQRILVEALGRVAGNRRLAANRAEGERRRERIVEMLLENANWIRQARPILRSLGESPNLPKALRKRAQEGGA